MVNRIATYCSSDDRIVTLVAANWLIQMLEDLLSDYAGPWQRELSYGVCLSDQPVPNGFYDLPDSSNGSTPIISMLCQPQAVELELCLVFRLVVHIIERRAPVARFD